MKHKLKAQITKYCLLVFLTINFLNSYSKNYPMPAPESVWGYACFGCNLQPQQSLMAMQYNFVDTIINNKSIQNGNH